MWMVRKQLSHTDILNHIVNFAEGSVNNHRLADELKSVRRGKKWLRFVDHSNYWAMVINSPQPEVTISRKCIEAIIHLYAATQTNFDIKRTIEWLFLHEIHHIELDHFKFLDRFGVARRVKSKPSHILNLHSDLAPLTGCCFELQADHEATDLILGAYSGFDLVGRRQNVMAISAMMVLIEREEAKLGSAEKTHPNAATRIFQLLCHVAEMPLISAHLQKDASLLPPADEIERYRKEVTLPCYFDAVHLAEVAGAESIKADLGNPEDFFADMAIVKLGDPSRYSDLKTEGAKEWALLWECNQALKPLQKGVHFAN